MKMQSVLPAMGLLFCWELVQSDVSRTTLKKSHQFNHQHRNKLGYSFLEKTELFRIKRAKRTNSGCPESCSCTVRGNDNKDVRCFGLRKTKVPDKVPADASSLNLAYNRIGVVEAKPLSELRYLKSIDLSNNKIHTIERNAFKDLGRVEWIDLSHNNLYNLSLADLSEAARNLIVLNISHTNLRELPRLHDDNGVYMTRLHHLILSNNNFTDIPERRIPNSITNLHFSCLKMSVLARSAFQGYYMLKELVIRGCEPKNKLSSIEDGAFDSLKALYKLDLSGNSLKDIPRSLPGSLEYLDLSHNQISAIKRNGCASREAIYNYFNVQEDENDFTDFGVGSELSRLTELIELQLNDNLIQVLCVDDFISMQHLEVLNLTNCAIKSFHRDTFLYPQSLRVLDLSRNFIKKFEIAGLTDLEVLYVERNFISEVVGLTNSKFPSLREGDFSYNRYMCDCKLKDFFHFLAGSYNQDVIFRYLSATSSRYTCFKPNRLRNKPLMSVNIVTELTCEEETTPIPWAAIAAPVSLVGIFIAIAVILCVTRMRSGKRSCCCDSNCMKGSQQTAKLTSSCPKYDIESDIAIQTNPSNKVAILCHETNQKWTLDTLVPKLNPAQPVAQPPNTEKIGSDKKPEDVNTPLQVEVFTIGKTIRTETLYGCIDAFKKIILIVTHEFLMEKACRYVLQAMQEQTLDKPEDTILCVMMDSIPWENMPETLQKLMVEKKFLQYPQKDRERQEFYFWDNLHSFVITFAPATRRKWQDDGEELVMSAHYQMGYDDEMNEEGICAMRAPRRAKLNNQTSGTKNISASRAARLRRLGINSEGEVINRILPGITEAKQPPSRSSLPNHNTNIVGQPEPRSKLMSQPSTYTVSDSPLLTLPVTPLPNHQVTAQPDQVLKDIDDLYSTRKDIFLFGANRSNNGRVHSLLPPNCDDVDSIYSDEEENEGEFVRPPERSRSPDHSSRPLNYSRKKQQESNDNMEIPHNVIENLHGTVVDDNEEDGNSVIEDEDPQTEEIKEDKSKKKNATMSRLKSFFLV